MVEEEEEVVGKTYRSRPRAKLTKTARRTVELLCRCSSESDDDNDDDDYAVGTNVQFVCAVEHCKLQ